MACSVSTPKQNAQARRYRLLNRSAGHVRRLKLPLPPLAEQRRIAEVLDRAEALRAKRRAALAQLDSLTQSLFLDLFGDPATNPKGWPINARSADYVRRLVIRAHVRHQSIPTDGIRYRLRIRI